MIALKLLMNLNQNVRMVRNVGEDLIFLEAQLINRFSHFSAFGFFRINIENVFNLISIVLSVVVLTMQAPKQW